MRFESYAAHGTPPLSAVCCKKQQQEDTPRAAVHVESSDTMRSQKAECQPLPDNPETGDTYITVEKAEAVPART